jgi:hypothetical protein
MQNHFITILVYVFVTETLGLHLQDNTQAQIAALQAQQNSFERVFNALMSNISRIDASLNGTPSVDEKIAILENAIISERYTVFNMSKILIPPFNVTRSGCEQMTDQQKVALLQQLATAKEQVYQLRNISVTLPTCPDVTAIQADIDKQLFFLDSMESIIYTNCSMNVILSPTVWQTNIYAPNWVLGNMTIDDLIEQYYQRSIRYDNITNCPLEYPFFDGSSCIQCYSPNPIFDISQRICAACPAGSQVDNAQKKCTPATYYTNWTNVSNFYPQTGPFPPPPTNISLPCPP